MQILIKRLKEKSEFLFIGTQVSTMAVVAYSMYFYLFARKKLIQIYIIFQLHTEVNLVRIIALTFIKQNIVKKNYHICCISGVKYVNLMFSNMHFNRENQCKITKCKFSPKICIFYQYQLHIFLRFIFNIVCMNLKIN